MKFLNDNNIPFAIRLREDLRVTIEDGHDLTLFARLRLARRTRTFRARMGAREDAETGDAPLLNFVARRLKDEWLIVVSNVAPRPALAAYRKRWAIECLFGDAKTRGLNLEDTRLTDPRKLALLMALVALALAWAGRAAAILLGPGAPKRKSHGYFAQSWFRTGFDHIRKLAPIRPRNRDRTMAKTHHDTASKAESRVVWSGRVWTNFAEGLGSANYEPAARLSDAFCVELRKDALPTLRYQTRAPLARGED